MAREMRVNWAMIGGSRGGPGGGPGGPHRGGPRGGPPGGPGGRPSSWQTLDPGQRQHIFVGDLGCKGPEHYKNQGYVISMYGNNHVSGCQNRLVIF